MGGLPVEGDWPEGLREAVGAEPVEFAVREGRAVSKAGASGAIVVGVLLILAVLGGAAFLFTLGGGVAEIEVGPITTSSDTPLGRVLLVIMAGTATLGGVALIALSPWLRSRPGSFFVGTPTRLLRRGWWRLEVVWWRDVESAKLVDGNVKLTLFPSGSGRKASAFMGEMVEVPGAAAVATRIGQLLALDAAPRDPAALAAPDLVVRATHAPGAWRRGRDAVFPFLALSIGALATLLFAGSLAGGGTMTFTQDGGAPQEVGASDAVAWIPTLIALGIAAAGALLIWRGLPKRRAVAATLTPTGLVLVEGAGQPVHHPWREFAGRVERRDTRRGVEIRLPMRTLARDGDDEVPSEVRLIGVQDAEAAEAALLQRVRA